MDHTQFLEIRKSISRQGYFVLGATLIFTLLFILLVSYIIYDQSQFTLLNLLALASVLILILLLIFIYNRLLNKNSDILKEQLNDEHLVLAKGWAEKLPESIVIEKSENGSVQKFASPKNRSLASIIESAIQK